MMSLGRAFELLFRNHEVALSVLNAVPNLLERIPIVCLHILIQILCRQETDGSWNHVCELTSYAVLAMSAIAKLPWMQQIDHGIVVNSITRGKSFLTSKMSEWGRGHHLWTEKVTFASDVLSEAFCLAASNTALPNIPQGCPDNAFLMNEKTLAGMKKAGALMARTPLVRGLASASLAIAELEACFAMRLLRNHHHSMFPRPQSGDDKYIFIIPLALIVCAGLHGCTVSPSVLYEMMVLSLLNFHVDEYMESVVEKHFQHSLGSIRGIVRHAFEDLHSGACAVAPVENEAYDVDINGHEARNCVDKHRIPLTINSVDSLLRQFITHILHHPAVQASPIFLRQKLASDLQTFLLAHITQAQHNNRFRAQHRRDGFHLNMAKTNGQGTIEPQHARSPVKYVDPGSTLYSWVRSISADHTSCPFSFVFFNCLIHAASSPGHHILASARTVYLAEDVCRHLASLCRMYNDLGSAVRDADEGSLNSLNFPEFFFRQVAPKERKSIAQDDLLWIAEHERQGLEMAMKLLGQELGDGYSMKALRIFVDVTDLYGQLYLLKDIGLRTQ